MEYCIWALFARTSRAVHHDVHPHFQCSDCGKVDCLSTDVLIPTIPNRTVDVSQILLQGTCEECLI